MTLGPGKKVFRVHARIMQPELRGGACTRAVRVEGRGTHTPNTGLSPNKEPFPAASAFLVHA